jgi:peptidyl-tRNA hydrolase, PTH1 family
LFRRRADSGEGHGPGDRILIVGLGNPGERYSGTRHNIGFEVAAELSRRWQLPRAKRKFGGLIAEGRTAPGGPRVAVLLPQTFMNESGSSAGPARGSLRAPLEHVVVLHDEIDLPFGEIQPRLGGGLAGHNGLKSLKRAFGDAEFWRVRVGVGRPSSSDPEVVSSYVLSRFRESRDDVAALIESAATEAERLVERIASAGEVETENDEAKETGA